MPTADGMKLAEFLAHLAEEPGWSDVDQLDVRSRAIDGDTPLHAALWARDNEAARDLVEAGADVNARGDDGYTPLHVAVAQANVEMAEFLVERGASWDAINEFGFSARSNARGSPEPGVRALVDGYHTEK